MKAKKLNILNLKNVKGGQTPRYKKYIIKMKAKKLNILNLKNVKG